MKFLNNQIMRSDGDSKLSDKKFIYSRKLSNQSKKPNVTLLFLPAKKIFHSIESQHFNFNNVGFFFNLPDTDNIKMNI